MSSLAGMIVGVLLVSVIPAVAANGDSAVLGAKNLSANSTKFISRNSTQFENTKPGRPAIRLIVRPGAPPMAVNSDVKIVNLNADLLDGQSASAFAASGHEHPSPFYTVTESGYLTSQWIFAYCDEGDAAVGGTGISDNLDGFSIEADPTVPDDGGAQYFAAIQNVTSGNVTLTVVCYDYPPLHVAP